MKIVCFRHGNSGPRLGALTTDNRVVDAALALDHELPAETRDRYDLDGPLLSALAGATANPPATATLALNDVQLLAPVPRPGKVICIGLNYRDHAEESGMDVPESPIAFSKFTTSVCGPGDTVMLPEGSKRSDYEAELAVVVGRTAARVSVEDAPKHVLGYACFNDVSEREYQFADGQWQRGKSCDTFGPLGEFIATPDEISDPHSLRIQLRLNGDTMQDSSTNQLIFQIPQLISHLSQCITLEPGDVIATGTPPGVGFARKPPVYLKDGDVMEVEIEGLGVLRNPVQAR